MNSSTKIPPSAFHSPVFITGIGLCCQTGSEPFALYGAVGTHLSGSKPHTGFGASFQGNESAMSLLHVPVDGLEGLQTPYERIVELAEAALKGAADQLPEEISADSVLVLTLMPSEETYRGAILDLEALQQRMTGCHSKLESACFRFASIGQGAVELLQQACAELNAEKWQVILFGGADSLVDMVTLSELAKSNDVMLQGGEGGMLPGEGAAYLVLEKRASSGTLARIEALSAAPEPNHGKANEKRMTGLSTSIQSVLQEANTPPGKLDSIVLPFGCTTMESLEWHQALETVWSRREKIPRTFEILLPAGTIGTAGAADLPISIALGCARFEFDFTPAERLIVCETGPGPHRGAVLLRKSLKG